MPLSSEEKDYIDSHCVNKEQCEAYRNEITKHDAAQDLLLEKINTKLGVLVGVLSAIGVAILGAVIKLIFA